MEPKKETVKRKAHMVSEQQGRLILSMTKKTAHTLYHNIFIMSREVGTGAHDWGERTREKKPLRQLDRIDLEPCFFLPHTHALSDNGREEEDDDDVSNLIDGDIAPDEET